MNYNSKADATKAAKKVLKLMEGKGWKINVWENMGWHFMVGSGPVSVHASENRSGKTQYCSMVNSEPGCFGPGLAMWTETGMRYYDPNCAARVAVINMLKVMDRLDATRRAAFRATRSLP